MRYFVKSALGVWIGVIGIFIILELLPRFWIQALALLAVILLFAVFSKNYSPEKRAANLKEAKQFWAKPIWMRIIFGIAIYAPPFALFLYISDLHDHGQGDLGTSLFVSNIFGVFMGIFLGWIHKRKQLTAQSD